jgi:hypothetical protein
MVQVAKRNKKELWRSVFRRVMSRYDEIKSVNGTQSCAGFYKSLAREGSNGGKFNPKVVVVTASDYICDVEITARRVLTPDEHRFFKLVYLTKDKEVSTLLKNGIFRELKRTVQEKVGLAFIAAKIHPFERYRKPRDLR